MANEANLKPYRKGESGNPKGRPKGSQNVATLLRKYLSKCEINDPEFGKVKGSDAIVLALIRKGINGDLASIKEIYDRLEGKASQNISTEFNNAGNPLEHLIIEYTSDEV